MPNTLSQSPNLALNLIYSTRHHIPALTTPTP